VRNTDAELDIQDGDMMDAGEVLEVEGQHVKETPRADR
jgi:hypothetical protein